MSARDGSALLPTPMLRMTSVAHAVERSGSAGPRSDAEGHRGAKIDGPAPAMSFDEVYTAHAPFVWRILRTLGVPAEALEDAMQDVFVVVHRRLPEFEGRAAITTWLFAIARRVAGAARRRAGGNRTEELVDEPAGTADTFATVSRAQAAATVTAILDELDEDKRLVFALVELEQMSVPEVAKMLDINLNTAYSRLRLARAAFEQAARRRGIP